MTEWKKKYPPPARIEQSMVEMQVSCAKCGKVRNKMSRHHKANDKFFAVLRPDDYAARYIQFHPDDVAWLCDKCHLKIHRLYHPIIKVFWKAVNELVAVTGFEEKDIISKEMCDEYKALCLKKFNQWAKVI